MKIIDNCWNNIYVSSAIFGDHHFSKDVAEIYIKEGAHLYPEDERLEVTEEEMYEREKKVIHLGACKLVFRNICRVHFRITPLLEKLNDQKESIEQDYLFGEKNGQMNDFCFGVNVKVKNSNFLLACIYTISAEKFSLHVFGDLDIK